MDHILAFGGTFQLKKNTVNFPICLHDFFLTIKKGTENLPKYYCKSGQVEIIETSPTKAVSTVYANLFNNSTQYLGWAGTMKTF